jgi:hypothetical protein
MSTLAEARYFERTAPQSGNAGTYSGSFVGATSTAAADLDLSTVGPAPAQGAAIQQPDTSQDQFVDIQNDGASGTLYVKFGPTAALVTSANAPSAAATGLNAAGACYAIPAGTTARFWIRRNADRWLGYVATSTTPVIRVFTSSRY